MFIYIYFILLQLFLNSKQPPAAPPPPKKGEEEQEVVENFIVCFFCFLLKTSFFFNMVKKHPTNCRTVYALYRSILQYHERHATARMITSKQQSSVILTIVGDWGNQWAPGETSVPFQFVWSTAFLGGILSYYSITLSIIGCPEKVVTLKLRLASDQLLCSRLYRLRIHPSRPYLHGCGY